MNALIEILNRFGENALHFAWPMLWQSSALIAILFAIDFALRRRVRAAVRYALWLVLLVKLLLPPSLALPTGVAWWLFPAVTTPARPHMIKFVVNYGADTAPSLPLQPMPAFTPPPRPPMSAAAWTILAWSAISVCLLVWLAMRWRQVVCDVRRATPVPAWLSELFDKTKDSSGLRRNVRLRLTDQAMSPAVCGLFRPVILLPQSLVKKLPPAQLRAVLLHELTHLRRGDVWMNCAQSLVQIVYWWHPLLWLANARIRRVREEAVDDAVMLALRDDAEAYAPTLLEVAKLAFHRPLASLGLVGILESRSALRQRIERLVNFRAPRKAGLTFVSLCGICLFSAAALPMGEAPAKFDELAVSAQQTEAADLGQDTLLTTTTNATGDHELVYKGKRLTEWLADLDDQNPGPANDLAVAAVHHIGTNGLPMIIPMLNPADPHHHGAVLFCYELGSKAKPAIPALINLLNEGYTRGYVGAALSRIGPDSIEPLTAALTNHNPSVRTEVVVSLGNMPLYYGNRGDQMLNTVPVLINCLKDQSPFVRSLSARSLGQIGKEEATVVPALVNSLKDTNSQVRWSSCLALGQFGTRAKRAVPALLAAGQDRDPDVRGTAAIALMQIEPENTEQLDRLMPVLIENIGGIGGTNVNFRSTTAAVLGEWGEKAKSAAPTLLKASQVTSGFEQQQIMKALRAIDPETKSSTDTNLYTHTFKVDTNVFLANLQKQTGLKTNVSAAFRQFLSNVGVDLSPPETIYFNHGHGILFVHATATDLEAAEKAVLALNNPAPPQIHIKARFVEVSPEIVKSLSGTFIPTAVTNVTGILAGPNLRSVLDTLEQSPGFENIAEPEATTLSGRQTQMRATDILTIITNFTYRETSTNAAITPQTTQLECGPVLGSIASVLPDGYTIDLRIIASLNEFLGYDTPPTNSTPVVTSTGAIVNVPIILPSFGVRQASTHMKLYDGQTVVLGGLISTQIATIKDTESVSNGSPAGEHPFREQTIRTFDKKQLLVLVTATLVDPAGNRIHSDDEMPFAKNGIPPQ